MRRAAVAFFLVLTAGLTFAVLTAPGDLPTFESVRASRISSDFVLEDADGEPLARLRKDFRERRREWGSLADLPSEVTDLLLRSEDRRFADHFGVDVPALMVSVFHQILGRGRRGGSTISMQLVKRLGVPSRTSSVSGKWRQIQAALRLERTWSKEQILEAYLNLAPFRGEVVGFPAAARAFFGKSMSRLSRAEGVLLVASLRGPNASVEKVGERACGLLPNECEQVRLLAPAMAMPRRLEEPNLAPHLAVFLSRENGGRFRSAIDRGLQIKAIETLRNHLSALKNRNVRDGALMVVEKATGRVIASVGSGGPFSRSPAVDGTRALRQAGSTLKPFLYGLAFDRKWLTPNSWLEDSPVDLVFPAGVYRPRNHDRIFHGWVRARTALASSLNVPAVKLLNLVGENAFWNVLQASGVHSLRPIEDYGPALALGVADLSLRELTTAYLTLANGGRPRALEHRAGLIGAEGSAVFSSETVATVEEILSSSADRTLGFGFDSGLSFPFMASMKTGTSKDMRDNWCLGWTKDYVIAVWVGNFDGEPMWDVSGLTGASPVWAAVARWLHENRRSQIRSGRSHSEEPADAVSSPIAVHRPAIEYPPNGLVVAIDPEIPSGVQGVPLTARTDGREGLHWRIGREHIPAGPEAIWKPRRGVHKIELLDGAVSHGAVEVIVR